MSTQEFDQTSALRRYSEYMHIISVGAYSENPPEGSDREPDGSCWYGDVNISKAVSNLEDRAARAGLKFCSTEPYKPDTQMTYVLAKMEPEEEAVFQVTEYVYRRHQELTKFNIQGFGDEELGRMSANEEGYLNFFFENIEIEETEQEEGTTRLIYYVQSTIMFLTNDGGAPIEGSTDTYEAYEGSNGQWIIDWHSS